MHLTDAITITVLLTCFLFQVFVYHKAFPMPVLSYRFGSIDPVSAREADDSNRFISCLCWRGESHSLVAANSIGDIEVLEMV